MTIEFTGEGENRTLHAHCDLCGEWLFKTIIKDYTANAITNNIDVMNVMIICDDCKNRLLVKLLNKME